MYEFVRGPLMWISFIIFIIGLAYQVYKLIKITGKKEKRYYTYEAKKAGILTRIKNLFNRGWLKRIKKKWYISLKVSILGRQPFISILSFIFHVCIIITPIFLVGHNILLFESWRFSLFTFSEFAGDILTIIFLVCAAIFLIRRIFIARIRAVSTIYDYLLLFITIAPFLTGYLAYHQIVDYRTIIIIHILSGELMLISVGLTKLSHMIFFFFARFFVGSEYSFRGGSRTWEVY